MCLFEKHDLLIWVNLEGYERRLMFRLQTTPDRREYNDFFTIEKPAEDGRGTDVLYTLPFKFIRDFYYMKPASDGPYKICIEGENDDPRLRNILVEKHCFSYFTFHDMERRYKKYKRS